MPRIDAWAACSIVQCVACVDRQCAAAAEHALSLVKILIEDGYLPVAELASACKANSCGLHSPAPLRPTEALFWRAACTAVAEAAADMPSCQDVLEQMAPEGGAAWQELLLRHLPREPGAPQPPPSDSRCDGDDPSRAPAAEAAAESLFLTRQLLSAAGACLDFGDASNRADGLMLCSKLLLATLPLACGAHPFGVALTAACGCTCVCTCAAATTRVLLPAR